MTRALLGVPGERGGPSDGGPTDRAAHGHGGVWIAGGYDPYA